MISTDMLASDFDFEPLKAKYEQERLKRVRKEGKGQFRATKGELTAFEEDPYTARIERDALHDEVDVVVIGGGFGGQLTAARLRKAGVESLRVIDEAGDFGGTWYWNRYPGLTCDIDSYCYLPWLEELGYMPTQKYASGDEIREFASAFGRKFDLYRDALFQTHVTEMRWDDDISRWIISTDRGDQLKARHVALALGPLNRLRLPGVPGVESFKGHSFHAARWDYSYTGGDMNGNLTGLRDKRVAILGTAASAIQVVPAVAEDAEELFVFQRTPSMVRKRGQQATDTEWWATLELGWQQRRMQNFNILALGGQQDEDLVQDSWTDTGMYALDNADSSEASAETLSPEEQARQGEVMDFAMMEGIRGRVDDVVKDPETAEALKPYYYYLCKRPCFSDFYLEAFNRSNTTLVDTAGQGVERITERGVVVDGKEYEVDCIIYATGYDFGTSYSSNARFDIIGKNGVKLSDKWGNGPRTLHGLYSNGFPNCYFLGLTQGTAGPNFTYIYDELSTQVATVVEQAITHDKHVVEATLEAEDGWVAEIQSMLGPVHAKLSTCTPGQYNNEGDVSDPDAAINRVYHKGTEAFFEILREWRGSGDFLGIDFS
jgi:cation diffusion facilitator CzcD-associated flavoprotein CzcO